MNQSTNGKIPVKYVLYAHYANLEKKDFQRWADGDGDKPAVLDGIAFLVSQFAALRDLLTAPGYEGLVVLFYAPGLTECFLGIEEGQTREELLKEHAALRFAQAVSSYIDGELEKDERLRARLRFVTALDLYDIFHGVNALDAEHLR